jgi:tetratricopeptide (TPR) repeat protein
MRSNALRGGLVGFPDLKARYDQAFAEFRAGRYAAAEAILGQLVATLDRLTVSSSAFIELDPVQYHLLKASANSLRGRAKRRMNREDEALADFRQAIALFEEWLPKTSEGIGFYHKDYGVALDGVGRKDEAFEVLQKTVEAAVTDAETYRYLGRNLQRQKRFQEAEGCLRRALELDPDDPFAYMTLGRNLEVQHREKEALSLYIKGASVAADRPSEALELLDRILEAEPRNVAALAAKADALAFQGRTGDALTVVDAALRIDPGHPAALATKGAVLGTLGRSAEALSVLEEALQHTPSDPIALAAQGEVLRQMGRWEDALNVLNDALRLSPEHVAALTTKGEVLVALGRADEALAVLDQALALSPDDSAVLSAQAAVLRRIGRYDEALVAIDRALHGGAEPSLLEAKARILRHSDRNEEALACVDEALRLDPESAPALATRAAVLEALERSSEALEAVHHALERDPGDLFALTIRAQILLDTGHPGQALEAVDDILAQMPDDPAALCLKGTALEALGRSDEAIAALDDALRHGPEKSTILAAKGRVLRAQRELKPAADVLQRAAQLAPNSASIYKELAGVLRELGRYEASLEAIDRLLQLIPNDLEWSRNKAFILVALRRIVEAEGTLKGLLEYDQGEMIATLRTDLAFAQISGDDYDGARANLDEALALDSSNSWARRIEGSYFCNIGDYEPAIETLTRALELDPYDDSAFGITGWAFQSLATLEFVHDGQRVQTYAEQAQHAYEEALRLAPGDLTWQMCLGEALHLLEREKEASGYYELVATQSRQEADEFVSAENLNNSGWCHYRLGQYSEAARLFIESLSLSSEALDIQFNLALALMCNRQYAVGLREYQRGLQRAEQAGVHVLRRRGLLSVAMTDLQEACHRGPSLEAPEAIKAQKLLERAWKQACRAGAAYEGRTAAT